MTEPESLRVNNGLWRAAGGVLAGLTTLFIIGFLFASAYGDFRLIATWGTVGGQHRWGFLGGAILCWALWEGARRRGERGQDSIPSATAAEAGALPLKGQDRAAPGAGLTRRGERVLAFWLLILNAALWLHGLYRSYECILTKQSDSPAVPFWQIHVLYGSVALGTHGLWRWLKPSAGRLAAALAAAVFALSPTCFSVTPGTVGAYFASVAALLALSALCGRYGCRNGRVVAGGAALVAVAVAALILHSVHKGWALNRLLDQLRAHGAPGLIGPLAAVGAVGWILLRRPLAPGLLAAGLLGLLGLVFGGARGETGTAGVVLLLPLAAILTATGLAFLRTRTGLVRTPLGRNLALIAMLGLLLGALREGVSKPVQPPPSGGPSKAQPLMDGKPATATDPGGR